MKIHFYKWTWLISRLIQWRTRSIYSHVAIEIDDHIYEAHASHGVVRSKYWHDQFVRRDTIELHAWIDEKHAIIDFLEEQLGKAYDYHLIWSIVLNTQGNDRSKWICSELVQKALEKAGILSQAKPYTPWELFLVLFQLQKHKCSII